MTENVYTDKEWRDQCKKIRERYGNYMIKKTREDYRRLTGARDIEQIEKDVLKIQNDLRTKNKKESLDD